MKRILKLSLSAFAGLGFLTLTAPSEAGQVASFDFVSSAVAISKSTTATARNPRLVQIASHMASQTASVPHGSIRLRVIPQVGAKAVREKIRWRIMTYGKDENGRRHLVAEVTGATPEISLPAGWYVVHARMKDKTIKHPVEVTAGKTFKYTLVKQ